MFIGEQYFRADFCRDGKRILTDVSEDTESRDAYYQECLQQMREAVETEPGAAQMLKGER